MGIGKAIGLKTHSRNPGPDSSRKRAKARSSRNVPGASSAEKATLSKDVGGGEATVQGSKVFEGRLIKFLDPKV